MEEGTQASPGLSSSLLPAAGPWATPFPTPSLSSSSEVKVHTWSLGGGKTVRSSRVGVVDKGPQGRGAPAGWGGGQSGAEPAATEQ